MFKVEAQGGDVSVYFSGNIDEDTNFSELELPSGWSQLILDMAGIKRINSVGLRSWLLWVKALDTQRSIIYRNCPKAVVQQMNMLAGFIPEGVVVESFAVPYYCESCNAEDTVLAIRGESFHEQTKDAEMYVKIPGTKICSGCGAEVEIDIIEESYYQFLKRSNI